MRKLLIIIITFLMSGSSSAQYGQYIGAGSGTTKLLLHLNGNSTDKSGNNNNGTDSLITYGLSYGKFGQGASFNGTSSKIKFADSSSLKPIGNFTVSLWMKSSIVADAIMFQSYSFNPYHAGFIIRTESTNGFCYFVHGTNKSNTQGVDWQQLKSTISVTDNKWHNIIVVYNGSNSFMYIDGNLNNSIAGVGYLAYNINSFVRVGCRSLNGGEDRFYTGLIDEVIIENRAWSKSEIKRYYTYSRWGYLGWVKNIFYLDTLNKQANKFIPDANQYNIAA